MNEFTISTKELHFTYSQAALTNFANEIMEEIVDGFIDASIFVLTKFPQVSFYFILAKNKVIS